MNKLTLNQFENSNEFRTILDGHYLEFIIKYKDGNLDLTNSKIKATIRILKKQRIIMKILGMVWLIETLAFCLAVMIFYHTEE